MLGISGELLEKNQWRPAPGWPCCPELVGRPCSRLVSKNSGTTWGPAWLWCGETTSAEQRVCDDLDRRLGFPQHPDQDSPAETGACFSVPNFRRPASTTPKIHDPDPLEDLGGVSAETRDAHPTCSGEATIQLQVSRSTRALPHAPYLLRSRPDRETSLRIRACTSHCRVEPTKDRASTFRGV